MCAVAWRPNQAERGTPDLVDQGRLDARYYNADGSRKDADDKGVPIDWESLDDELISQGKDPKFYNPDGAKKDKGLDGVLIDWETIQREREIEQPPKGPSERHIAVNRQLQVAQDNINLLGLRINSVQAELSHQQFERLPPGAIDIHAKVERARLEALQKDRDGWVHYRDSMARKIG